MTTTLTIAMMKRRGWRSPAHSTEDREEVRFSPRRHEPRHAATYPAPLLACSPRLLNITAVAYAPLMSAQSCISLTRSCISLFFLSLSFLSSH